MVREAVLFSSNETLDNVPTTNLKYLLVSYYIGELTRRVLQQDRVPILKTSQDHLKSFISKCEAMKLIPENEFELSIQDGTEANREARKTARFNRQKNAQEKLQVIRERKQRCANSLRGDAGVDDVMDDNAEDEREGWLATISLACCKAHNLHEMLDKEVLMAMTKEKDGYAQAPTPISERLEDKILLDLNSRFGFKVDECRRSINDIRHHLRATNKTFPKLEAVLQIMKSSELDSKKESLFCSIIDPTQLRYLLNIISTDRSSELSMNSTRGDDFPDVESAHIPLPRRAVRRGQQGGGGCTSHRSTGHQGGGRCTGQHGGGSGSNNEHDIGNVQNDAGGGNDSNIQRDIENNVQLDDEDGEHGGGGGFNHQYDGGEDGYLGGHGGEDGHLGGGEDGHLGGGGPNGGGEDGHLGGGEDGHLGGGGPNGGGDDGHHGGGEDGHLGGGGEDGHLGGGGPNGGGEDGHLGGGGPNGGGEDGHLGSGGGVPNNQLPFGGLLPYNGHEIHGLTRQKFDRFTVRFDAIDGSLQLKEYYCILRNPEHFDVLAQTFPGLREGVFLRQHEQQQEGDVIDGIVDGHIWKKVLKNVNRPLRGTDIRIRYTKYVSRNDSSWNKKGCQWVDNCTLPFKEGNSTTQTVDRAS